MRAARVGWSAKAADWSGKLNSDSKHKERISLMKRCPKCNRSFPDDNQKFCTVDGGLLVTADKPFDPNATIASANLPVTPVEPPREAPPATPEPDFGATIATSSSAPTAVLPRKTGPTGSPTSSNLQPSQPTTPPPPPSIAPARPQAQSVPLPQSGPLPPVSSAPPK